MADEPHDSSTYGQVISKNIDAARSRAGLKQSSLAARMKALGFAWHQQTVGAVERGDRRVTAEEIMGLALALETTITDLLEPKTAAVIAQRIIRLPSGQTLFGATVAGLTRNVNDGRIRWEGDKPHFGEPRLTGEGPKQL